MKVQFGKVLRNEQLSLGYRWSGRNAAEWLEYCDKVAQGVLTTLRLERRAAITEAGFITDRAAEGNPYGEKSFGGSLE